MIWPMVYLLAVFAAILIGTGARACRYLQAKGPSLRDTRERAAHLLHELNEHARWAEMQRKHARLIFRERFELLFSLNCDLWTTVKLGILRLRYRLRRKCAR